MVWDHFYSAKVPFCCFRNNFYTSSKRYHTTKAQTTAFFDSTFNYLRQQGQLTVHDSTLHSGRLHVNPLPSVSAHGLQIDDERNLPDTSAGIVMAGTGNTVLNVINLSPALLKSNYLPKISIGEADVTSKKPIISKKTQQIRQFSTNYELKESKVSIKDAVRNAAKKIKLDEAKKEEIAAKVENPAKPEQLKEQPVQDDSTFLKEQSTQILLAHEAKDYNKINSIYMALKRNNIVPSREIYKIVLNSISLRTLDDSVDEKLSVMLTVYQDLITNKIKPDLSIYSIVLEKLLDSSILSFKDSNVSNNGFDFFKIAIDIFNASNVSNIQQFDYKILNSILIGMNLYPGIVNIESLMKLFQKNGQDGASSFEKNQFYFIGLINYCKKLNDPTVSIKLYEEFKELSKNNENNLVNYQFEVYSVFISTLIETNQISIATKFLDKLLISIKNFENYEPKISKLLSSYILSLSKINAEKSFEIWENFNKIQWIPDFSYNFYSNFLPNLNEISYEKQLKVYNLMSAMEIKQEPTNLENILIVPKINKPSISLFLVNAIEHNDKQTVLKIVKESFLRSNQFQPEVYPLLFDYLNNLNLSLSIVNNHGINSADKFKFLNDLIISVNSNNNNSEISLNVLNQIYKTNYFKELINCFNLNENNSNLYNNSLFGMITIFNNSIFTQHSNTNKSLNSSSSNSDNLQIVELLAPLIIEFNDTLNYYTPRSNELIQFKSDLNTFFKFQTQTMDLSNCSSQVHEALELLKN